MRPPSMVTHFVFLLVALGAALGYWRLTRRRSEHDETPSDRYIRELRRQRAAALAAANRGRA